MGEQDDNTARSPTERRWCCLLVPAPGTCDPSRRIDSVNHPDLDLLWGDFA